MAQFIIGNYGHGLEDAQRAIILNPSYHKAYYRAARCAERLRKYSVAIELLTRGKTVIDPPRDEAITKEFDELLDQVKAAQAKANEKSSK